jgi:hypothetical protein
MDARVPKQMLVCDFAGLASGCRFFTCTRFWGARMSASGSCLYSLRRYAAWTAVFARWIDAVGRLYCRYFHGAISLPVNGRYRCWRCLREFDLEWSRCQHQPAQWAFDERALIAEVAVDGDTVIDGAAAFMASRRRGRRLWRR